MDSKQSILIVSNGFYPELSPRSFRATELVKEFCRLGHSVVVITKHREHDYTEFMKERSFTLKMWGKSQLPKIPEYKSRPWSLLSRLSTRILQVLFEYPGIEEMFQVRKMLKKENGYDLIISFAVPFPVHWGVAKAWSKNDRIAKRWVADCGDPYMFARLDRFRKPFYFKYLELEFSRKCDYIAIPFEELKNQFYPQFISKIVVIPQGLNFKEIKLSDESQIHNYPVFVFAGSIIPGKRDLNMFFEYLITIPTDFRFIIYTNQKELYARYQLALGDKLELRGYIDRLALIYEMSKVDFLVNVDTIYDCTSNMEAIPSKLIDYSIANRPILNINSESLDKGLVVEFMNRDYSRQRIIEKSNYDIRKVAAKFLELID